METQEYILIETFCEYYGVETSLISSLQEFGLIELIEVESSQSIAINHLSELEKIIRLHNDLAINREGIDVILQLLKKINLMNKEMVFLKNRLALFEEF